MTGPSSTPRGEAAPRPGATWETELVRAEQLVDDDAPEPRPNRATRRALARRRPAPTEPLGPSSSGPACICTYGERCENCRD